MESEQTSPDIVEPRVRIEAVTAMALSYPDGVIITDRDDLVVFVNLSAVGLLGHDPNNIVGQPLSKALEELILRARDPQGIQNLLQNSNPTYPLQLGINLITPDIKNEGASESLNLKITMFSVYNAEGNWVGRTLILHNTIQEHTADQIKNEFVAVVSHELRTPLSAIQGFSELLLTQDASPERQRLWLEMINRESVRLSGLIEDMLSLSHIESGRIDLRLERVELELVIRQCVEILRIGSSRHNFHIEVEENLPAVRADRDKLIQILNNIIGNAIKYSNKGGQINIKVGYNTINPLFLEVSVSDQGVGIPADDLTNIFEKFYRVRNGTTKEIKGSGLGLAITRNLVELIGGRIWVESEVGKGSTFLFTLPVHVFPQREVKAFREILLKTLLVEGKDPTEAELYLDYLQRTLPNNQLDEVLRETLYEIGDMWHQGKIGIGDEHLATGIVREFLSRTKAVAALPNGFRLVIGSVAGEEHVVGLTMVANTFIRAGWAVTNLGANVPVAAFITTIEQSRPDLLLLSITLSQRLSEIKGIVQEVKKTNPDLLIGVGGRLLNELPDLATRLGADFRGTSPDETVRLATQIVREKKSEVRSQKSE